MPNENRNSFWPPAPTQSELEDVQSASSGPMSNDADASGDELPVHDPQRDVAAHQSAALTHAGFMNVV